MHKIDEKKAGIDVDSTADSTSGTVRLKILEAGSNKKQGHGRTRSASDGTALLAHSLSIHHPAWSLTSLLDAFGPLIFPVHRAALLRKRILFSCHAPVQETCNFGNSTLSQYMHLFLMTLQFITYPFFQIRLWQFPMYYRPQHPLND